MNKATLTALNASIAHWKRLATGKSKPDERPYSADCALCGLFYMGWNICEGCPVAKKTGHSECIGSPYFAARDAFIESGKRSKAFRTAARAELEFLRSLLPSEKRTTTKKKTQ